MINIPSEFENILKKDIKSQTSVNQTILNIQPIIEENKLVFFPEYTNHGEKHINSVLILASKIIESKSYDLLEPSDVEAIICSILLHDLGMHLSYSGFLYLLESENYSLENVYKDKKWKILWENYIKEAKKWNSDKLKNIFGEIVKVEDIPNEEIKMTKMHKLLVGEFLRRYHHRLAYDIAISGFPGNMCTIHCLGSNEVSMKKVIAHISRSHGMELWKIIDYINEEYGNTRRVSGVKIIYIMSILRIADFFDIDKTRANKILFNIYKMDSSISQEEWIKHNCIEDIDLDYQEDKESIFIRILDPDNSNIYLKIERLIQELQIELDKTWAVIGKIYTRYADLKLKFRRVYSNLSILESRVPYITKSVKFDVNRNILFSLTQPLYGGNPSYGIRELIQNAIDACEERKCESLGYDPQVSITIQDTTDCKQIIIEDNGIGMNEEVIINYFLTAGSSLREDTQWKNKFIVENQTIVMRNGKFGVGVLAAFLLGEKIEVETVPKENEYIYRFQATLDMKQIELIHKKREDEEFGTKIIIETNDSVISLLKKQWDDGWNRYNYRIDGNVIPWYEWYKFNSPKLKIVVPNEWKERKIEFLKIKEKSNGWKSFKTNNYERIDWTYGVKSDNYKLICNGIIISNAYEIRDYDFPRDLKIPLISVIDKEGTFPLNLSRSGIEEQKLPFENIIMQEIYIDMLNQLELMDNLSSYKDNVLDIKDGYLKHPAIGRSYYYANTYGIRCEELIFNKKGYCLCYDYNLKKLKNNILTKIWVNEPIRVTNEKLMSIIGDNVILAQRDMPNSIDSYKFCLDMNFQQELGRVYWFFANYFVIKKQKYEYLFQEGKNRMRSGFVIDLEILSQNDEWICVGRKGMNIQIDINELGDLDGIEQIVQYKFETRQDLDGNIEKNDILNKILEERYKDKIFLPYYEKSVMK